MREVTLILQSLETGESSAAQRLLPIVYKDLRRVAASKMARESPDHTLQPTALVHEAWLRLLKPGELERIRDEDHFVAAAAGAMRRILVESARRKKRIKHGGALKRVNVDELDVPLPLPPDEIIALNDALDRLSEVDQLAAEVVKLRFFTGLTQEEVAEEMDTPLRTVERRWKFAKAWLFREVQKGTRAAP